MAGATLDEEELAAVCVRYGVARLMIFGSVARGTAEPSSDVDVLYELQPGRRLGWEIEDLSDELSEPFGRPVDLVSRASLHERLRAAVLAEAQPLYAASLVRSAGASRPVCATGSSTGTGPSTWTSCVRPLRSAAWVLR